MADNDNAQIYKKRYKVVKKLGAGNSATTYLVIDLEEKNELKALKIVRLGEMDPEQTVDFVKEAELQLSLNNEHIVKLYESFFENNSLYIVSEFCEGGDLNRHLKELKKQNQTLEEDQVIEWLIQILLAVEHMHKSRILHRDLKAKNIFLKSNQMKIANFSISRIYRIAMDLSITFVALPFDMPPEVMKDGIYESKSDIWSIGCLLYEMCTYQHAFDAKGLINVANKIVEGKSRDLPKAYSKELNDLLKKMFMKDPKNRPSATQLLQTPFITRHRERTKLTGPLENTISGNLRSREISTRFEMKNKSGSITSEDHIADDSNDIQPGNIPCNQLHEEEEEEEQLTIKPANTFKSVKQTMHDKKVHEPYQNRRTILEKISIGSMIQPQSSPKDVEQARSKVTDDTSAHGNNDDPPVTLMQTSYREIADKLDDDRSPTRERRSSDSTLKSQRTISVSQRSTMNSMSQTIDPRHTANFTHQLKETIGSTTRSKPSLNASVDDGSATLKDSPDHDASALMAKHLKIDNLRTKAIKLLGKSTFEKVYNYLVKQRTAQKTDPNLDDAKIAKGLTAFVIKPADCFIVDQLVLLELL